MERYIHNENIRRYRKLSSRRRLTRINEPSSESFWPRKKQKTFRQIQQRMITQGIREQQEDRGRLLAPRGKDPQWPLLYFVACLVRSAPLSGHRVFIDCWGLLSTTVPRKVIDYLLDIVWLSQARDALKAFRDRVCAVAGREDEWYVPPNQIVSNGICSFTPQSDFHHHCVEVVVCGARCCFV